MLPSTCVSRLFTGKALYVDLRMTIKAPKNVFDLTCRTVAHLTDLNGRMPPLDACLHVSHLENLIQTGRHIQALDEYEKWQVGEFKSLLVLRVLPTHTMALGNIHRCQGKFQAMCDTLESCPLRPHDTTRYRIICGRADAFIELGMADSARKILSDELHQATSRGCTVAQRLFRRLCVSMADAEAQGGSRKSAEQLIGLLRSSLHTLKTPDIIDQMFHVRILVAQARLQYDRQPRREALAAWEEVIEHVRKFSSFNSVGATYADKFLPR